MIYAQTVNVIDQISAMKKMVNNNNKKTMKIQFRQKLMKKVVQSREKKGSTLTLFQKQKQNHTKSVSL